VYNIILHNLEDRGELLVIMTADAENFKMLVKQAKLLIPRLEKITSDSSWAHRASGCRGSLIRLLEVQMEDQKPGTSFGYARDDIDHDDISDLRSALDLGFEILEKAAAERFG
jgi:hypothetical protein